MGGVGNRMRNYKSIENGYIIYIGIGNGGVEITETEYNEILTAIQNKPVARDGYDYRLKTDLSWEEYEKTIPEPVDETAEISDYENALADMGVRFGD